MERGRDDPDSEGATGFSRPDALDVQVGYDEQGRFYYVLSSNIPGLHIEAPTFELLVEIAIDATPDLLDLNLMPNKINFRQTVALVPPDGR